MSICLKYTNKTNGAVFFSVFYPENPSLFRQRVKEMQKVMRKKSVCDVTEVSERTYHNATKQGAR